MLAFTAGSLLTPTDAVKHPLMLVEHGRILEISARNTRQLPAAVSLSDFGDGGIAPGYVDLHIHGSAGCDVMDDRADALPAIEQLLARHGARAISQPRLPLRWSQLCGRWNGWRMRLSNENKIAHRMCKTSVERFPSESIWRGRFSAMRGEGYIRRNICWLRRCLCSSNCGRRHADGFA